MADQCDYIFTKGIWAGQQCRNRAQEGSTRCKACEHKRAGAVAGGRIAMTPYDGKIPNRHNVLEEDVLAWLATDPPIRMARSAISKAIDYGHSNVLRQLANILADDSIEVDNAYRVAFDEADSAIARAEMLREAGFGLALENPADSLIGHPAALVWYVKNASDDELANHGAKLDRLAGDEGLAGAVRRLISVRAGKKITWRSWQRLHDLVLLPQLTPDQKSWVPTWIGQNLINRRARMEASLSEVVPTDLTGYLLRAV